MSSKKTKLHENGFDFLKVRKNPNSEPTRMQEWKNIHDELTGCHSQEFLCKFLKTRCALISITNQIKNLKYIGDEVDIVNVVGKELRLLDGEQFFLRANDVMIKTVDRMVSMDCETTEQDARARYKQIPNDKCSSKNRNNPIDGGDQR